MDDTIMNNDLTRQVLQKVREYMAAKKMSMSEFARQTGVSKAWLSKLKHTDANLSLNTAQDLLHYMGYTLRLTREGGLQISPSRLKKYATNYVKDGYLLWIDSLDLAPAPAPTLSTDAVTKLKLKRKAAETPAIGVGVTTMTTPTPAPAATIPAPPTITSPNSNQAPVKLSPGQTITVSASAAVSDPASSSGSDPATTQTQTQSQTPTPAPVQTTTATNPTPAATAPTPTTTAAEISEKNLNRTANFKDLRRTITAAAKEQQKRKDQNAEENNEFNLLYADGFFTSLSLTNLKKKV